MSAIADDVRRQIDDLSNHAWPSNRHPRYHSDSRQLQNHRVDLLREQQEIGTVSVAAFPSWLFAEGDMSTLGCSRREIYRSAHTYILSLNA